MPAPATKCKTKSAWNKNQICLDYLSGKCNVNRYHCKFIHPELKVDRDSPLLQSKPGQPNVCKIYVLTGYCKFGNHCRDFHPALGEVPQPKALPPQQPLKLKKQRAKDGDQHPEWHGMETGSLRDSESCGTQEPMTPTTCTDPMTPWDPQTPPSPMSPVTPTLPMSCTSTVSSFSPLILSPGCALVCTGTSMPQLTVILSRLTEIRLEPVFRDLLRLMDSDRLLLPFGVVSVVLSKAISESKPMIALHVELCRRLLETVDPDEVNATNIFDLAMSLLMSSLLQPAGDEQSQDMIHTRQIGSLNVMAELYNNGMIGSTHINSVISWLVHNTQQTHDQAMYVLSVELLCDILASVDEKFKDECPGEHAKALLGLTSTVQGHRSWLLHNAKQVGEQAAGAVSVELLCNILSSVHDKLKVECPDQHAQALLDLTATVQGHSNRLKTLAMTVCQLSSVEASPPALQVHSPYANKSGESTA